MQTATFNSGLGTFGGPARTTAVFLAPEGGIAQLSLADGDGITPEATPTAEPAATVPQPGATAEALAFLTPGPELAETRAPLWVLALILLVGVGAAVACVLYRGQRRYQAMKTVQLGNTGVKVSMFCLGAMRFGWDTDPAMSYRLLDMYVQAGGSFIDTANIYGREGGKRVGSISETLPLTFFTHT